MGSPLRVGIIGAGPRGLTALERITSHAREHTRPVRIHVFDPFPPGAGRVWTTDQSPHLLMNTVLEEQTVFPDESCTVEHNDAGPSMAQWAGSPTPSGHFPQRRQYGEYLSWSWNRVVDAAPPHVSIRHEAAEVIDITEVTAAQTLHLADGRMVDVDAVILCVGHIPSALTDERAQWTQIAQDTGLTYLPPGLPAESPVDRLPAGEPVLIRGFGLNFFDLQSLLTHGRGGVFTPADDGTLTYTPSGNEPLLIPGSRRGVPYRSKPITPRHPLPAARSHRLRYFTRTTIDRLPVRGDGLRFDEQLWPLILADLRAAWYTALGKTRPDTFAEEPEMLVSAASSAVDRVVRADAAHESERWHVREERVLRASVIEAEPHLVFDVHRLLRPLGDEAFHDRDALRTALLTFLRHDLQESLAGPDISPLKSLFPVLWQSRALLKELVAEDRLSPVSFVREVRGWFEDFVSGMCDGPPPQRFAELIALTEAGIVDFAGPQVRITAATAPHEPAGFVATSPAVPGEIRARTLVDASSPANRVQQADDSLIRSMIDRGQLCVADHLLDDGTHVPSTGLAVTEAPFRTVDAAGNAHPHRYCLSIQLSSVQLGLAIAANPGANAQTIRDADAVARAILGHP